MAQPRLRTRWFRDGASRDAATVASAAAAIVWRTADARVKHLRRVDFAIDAGAPYVDVLAEFLCLLVAIADRLAYAREAGPWRVAFTTALAGRVGALLEESLRELAGDAAEGQRRRFIDTLNARMDAYAAYRFDENGPEFAFLRCFAERVAEALPDAFDRRWGADQAMSVEGPAAVEQAERALRALLARDYEG